MCRLFSVRYCVHSQYRTGCFEKCLSRPPMMWRQEWHDNVYAHSITTLTTQNDVAQTEAEAAVGRWNARIAS